MSLKSLFEKEGKKVLSVMEVIEKDGLKLATEVQKYLPEATALAELLFPSEAATIKAASTEVGSVASTIVNVAGLIQQAVVQVETKAAALPSTLTDEQKSAEVLTLVSGIVTSDLATLKITVDAAYLQTLINAVVAILNVPSVAV